MLALVNINRIRPAIAPIGLDYVAGAARAAGVEVEVLDLGLAATPGKTLRDFFAHRSPSLVGVSLRNVDDCFWPSATPFLPDLMEVVAAIRAASDAPIVLGGVGFSIFAERIVELTGADFGVRGDGESATAALYREWLGRRRFEHVPGLIWRLNDRLVSNPPAWPGEVSLVGPRDAIDNPSYFRLGGQVGVETKRGCSRRCTYCADPLAKGPANRLRPPSVVADEMASLLSQGVDVLHLCDSEFNLPASHAMAVCEELARRGLGERMRWYAYLAVTPFEEDLAVAMRRAGCVGINFTGDSGSEAMLTAYRQPHGRPDIARAVALCRRHGIAVMVDLLLGGPGETEKTAAESIAFFKQIEPDCVGAALGVRLYPGTEIAQRLAAEGSPESNPGIRRRYDGPIDLVKPTFYLSPALGERPAAMIRRLIGGDPRFFEPEDDSGASPSGSGDHNYNQNTALVEAIAAGERGAYWDILRRLRR